MQGYRRQCSPKRGNSVTTAVKERAKVKERQVKGQEALWAVTLLLISLLRTLLALGCHVGMADEKAEDNLKKTKLPKT